MEPLTFFALLFGCSMGAGALGALLGLGGGVILVPVLTLMAGLDIHYAIGASIVSVIATSSGAAATYVGDRITNLRLGMFLEMATTTGAVTGALVAGILPGQPVRNVGIALLPLLPSVVTAVVAVLFDRWTAPRTAFIAGTLGDPARRGHSQPEGRPGVGRAGGLYRRGGDLRRGVRDGNRGRAAGVHPRPSPGRKQRGKRNRPIRVERDDGSDGSRRAAAAGWLGR